VLSVRGVCGVVVAIDASVRLSRHRVSLLLVYLDVVRRRWAVSCFVYLLSSAAIVASYVLAASRGFVDLLLCPLCV